MQVSILRWSLLMASIMTLGSVDAIVTPCQQIGGCTRYFNDHRLLELPVGRCNTQYTCTQGHTHLCTQNREQWHTPGTCGHVRVGTRCTAPHQNHHNPHAQVLEYVYVTIEKR
ncbi:uncharacterized protein PGTG_16635 [Puccinia graminis f. sp. tritici CRL 75-36-700-3]|uniref:Secreted protein n=1 Tax=Puccinia graminis f. sp. tritici (strain CRL 75-36-700-3 / race SCCL) TaxID=418459 RepID=E3L234_PUCGT|nr:uncharacterized protein PGTG_16635 [Puccinia graminis f. sp. tritici CRL 75-36-700-3]EFP90609.1 hypothetical protein PGTG_16635 [Puccinia graminis f. sp. tritici CRL 75-36-700-3]